MAKAAKEYLEDLFRVMHKFRRMQKHEVIKDLSKGEFYMLMSIYESACGSERQEEEPPGIIVSELAHKLMITNPAASKMLRNMEKKGYIVRISDSADRRLTYIALSEQGKNLIGCVWKNVQTLALQVVERMGEQDTEELIRLLNKLFQIMEQQQKEEKVLY